MNEKNRTLQPTKNLAEPQFSNSSIDFIVANKFYKKCWKRLPKNRPITKFMFAILLKAHPVTLSLFVRLIKIRRDVMITMAEWKFFE